jgi:hypothetical protein
MKLNTLQLLVKQSKEIIPKLEQIVKKVENKTVFGTSINIQRS